MTKLEKILYSARAHTTGGRDNGTSRTSDGRLEVQFSVPGNPGAGTNPEQLFGACAARSDAALMMGSATASVASIIGDSK